PGPLAAVVADVFDSRVNSSADSIATTEATGAFNAGADFERTSRGVKQKEWHAHKDGRTRPSHLAADGQTVPQDGYFTLGGDRSYSTGDFDPFVEGRAKSGSTQRVKLRYPGDPAASRSQTKNCRCAALAKRRAW